MPDILAFFLQTLNDSPELTHKPEFVQIAAPPKDAQVCTSTGQVATSLGGATLYSINRSRANALSVNRTAPSLQKLVASIVSLTHVSVMPGIAATASFEDVRSTLDHRDHVVKVLNIEGQDSSLPAVLSTPAAPGRYPLELVLNSRPGETDVESHSPADHVVLVLGPRPSPLGGEPAHCIDSNGFACTNMNPTYLGPFYLLSQRAMLVNKTLVGLRMDDVFSVINSLCSQRFVDCTDISAHSSGAYGVVLLYAAVLDKRFAHISVDHSLSSYRSVVDSNLHRDVSESVFPGALLHFDVPDVVAALGKRVTVTNPIAADGEVISPMAVMRSGIAR
jgi:hypothetical protein